MTFRAFQSIFERENLSLTDDGRWRLGKRITTSNEMLYFHSVVEKNFFPKTRTVTEISSLAFPNPQFALNIRARKVHVTVNPSPKKRVNFFFARNLHEKLFSVDFLSVPFCDSSEESEKFGRDVTRRNLRLCLSVEHFVGEKEEKKTDKKNFGD